MDDQLDNDLKNRIKEVFEDYDDTTADEGWLQLRKKYPEEQSNRGAFAWIWRGAAAAILLLFLGIGLWMYNKQPEPKKLSYKPSKTSPSEKTTSGMAAAHPDIIHKTNTAKAEDLATTAGNAQPKTSKSNTLKNSTETSKPLQPDAGLKIAQGDTAAQISFIAKNRTDSAKTIKNDETDQQLAVTVKPGIANFNPVQTPAKAPERSMASVFAEEKKTKPLQNDEKIKTDSKRVHFGVYATTYFNYAKGSNNQINAGAGVSSDISISKNLKLVTGVAIAQNTLNYTGGVPPAAGEQVALLPAASRAIYASLSNSAVPTFKNYNASLVGLDIPLNLKYEFNPQKGDTYVSAGLSSGTFINESYTYQYNNPSFFTSSVQQTQGETTSKSFNSFYFAKTLNVAFGVGYPLGKNHLIIEPFLKYPLEGLGAQQIRFGAGGLNLKFNFQSSKK